MYCTKDCACSLCRELRGYKPMKPAKPPKRPAPRPPPSLSGVGKGISIGNSLFNRFNENFILRRRIASSTFKTFQPQSLKCSEMYQQRQQQTSTPSPTPIDQQPSIEPKAAGNTKCNLNTGQQTTLNPLNKESNGIDGIGAKAFTGNGDLVDGSKPNHKVVIYFGDSIAHRSSRHQGNNNALVGNQQQKLDAAELVGNLGQRNNILNDDDDDGDDDVCYSRNDNADIDELPPYIESIQNGVINIKIEGNYQRASALVETVSKPTRATVLSNNKDNSWLSLEENFINNENNLNQQQQQQYDTCDWSFVQEWRRFARPIANMQQPHSINSCPTMPSTSSTAANITTNRMITNGGLNATNMHNLPTANTQNGLITTTPKTGTHVQNAGGIITPMTRLTTKEQRPAQNTQNSNVTSTVISGPNFELYREPKSKVLNIVNSYNNVGGGAQPQSKTIPQRPIPGPARLTVQSTPVKSQPPMVSGSLTQSNLNSASTSLGIPTDTNGKYQQSSTATGKPCVMHHHEFHALHRVQEYHSSSDENRSSGHASMSDTGGHGSSSPGVSGVALGPLPEDRLAAGVTNRSTRSRASNSGHARPRHHRATPATTKSPWVGGSGLEDIKQAMQQLTLRSQTSTSTYSSLSAGSESSEPARRLARYSSLETVNTNVTSADEFVWVDSHNRLVELQNPPWTQHCIMRVIRNGRCKEQADRISVDTVPRLGYLLQRALVRIGREVQRFSANLGLCSKHEVAGALRVVLCPALADSCIKACLRAAAMFAVPGDSALKQSKSARAGLQLPVGRFHHWMTHARLGKFIHEYAAVYLCAGMENLLEEILLQSLLPVTATTIATNAASGEPTSCQQLTVNSLELSISSSGDLYGLLQPLAHLNAGRIATGALRMPRWASQTSLGKNQNNTSPSNAANSKLEPCLLTTCVGSMSELRDLAMRAQQKFQHTALSNAALNALFYFMRCSQLELGDTSLSTKSTVGIGNTGLSHSNGSGPTATGMSTSATSGGSNANNVQELCYERAFVVLPPLVEWLRVASAHAEYRSAVMIDKDDIMQAARLLLPGVDCPMRPIGHEEELPMKKTHFTHAPSSSGSATPLNTSLNSSISEDTTELGKRAAITLAFKLMLTGRAELLAQAANLLPPTTRYDTLNHAGMTALMIASIRNDDIALQALLDAGCDPNIEVPAIGHPAYSAIHPDTQHWTAVTFAACRANYLALRMLLERGGKVEGGARLSEEKATLTPLQVACGTGCIEIVSLLLAHGANAFLSTQQKDTLCFAGSAQRGTYCAISVAAAHGQRAIVRKLLSHPMSPNTREVLSLEEMLAEGDPVSGNTRGGVSGSGNERSSNNNSDMPTSLSKSQIKSLQEAMYHCAENGHLDITIELRTLGVPWTLHCWMHALSAARDHRLDAVIDQLLQDFLQVCPDDYSVQFVNECLPLLFIIFRHSKNEWTTLLLADIFATCFGRDSIKPIKEPILTVNTSRIDPVFVNNPELSDVTFRVEGKIFYGHKIVLVTASPIFQTMLSSKLNDGKNSTPTVQIDDIRYPIFQLIMQYLYSGNCGALDVSYDEMLELIAAASFFQLESLQRYAEARSAEFINTHNVVETYIHAKVYNSVKLLKYCQGFLLQNMVALLTNDDSVKRLLFAKQIPNHDVLSGLLQTLQQRIKQRKPNTPIGGGGHFRAQLSSPPSFHNNSGHNALGLGLGQNGNNASNVNLGNGGGSLGAMKKI